MVRAALLVVTVPIAAGLRPVDITPTMVTKIVGHCLLGWPATVSWTAVQDAIVEQVRIPRVLLGAVVGAGLAITSTALQAMVRNVLAEPYLLGVSLRRLHRGRRRSCSGSARGWAQRSDLVFNVHRSPAGSPLAGRYARAIPPTAAHGAVQ